MTYDVQRWDSPDYDVELDPLDDGLWVLAADAEAHEKAAVEAYRAGIRESIAVIEYLHDEAPHDAHRDALWNAISALRALLEGSSE